MSKVVGVCASMGARFLSPMVCVQVCCQIDVGVIVVDASVKGGARAPHEINGVHTGQRRMLCAFRLCLPNGETSWPRLVVGCRRLLLLRDALAVVES
jgi:hypothetical protein